MFFILLYSVFKTLVHLNLLKLACSMWETLQTMSPYMVNLFLKKDKPNEFNHGTMETALKLIWVQGRRIQLQHRESDRFEKKKTSLFIRHWDLCLGQICCMWLYILEGFYFRKFHQSKQEFDVDSGFPWVKAELGPCLYFCTRHFGLLCKMNLSNSLLFWDFVQKEV